MPLKKKMVWIFSTYLPSTRLKNQEDAFEFARQTLPTKFKPWNKEEFLKQMEETKFKYSTLSAKKYDSVKTTLTGVQTVL